MESPLADSRQQLGDASSRRLGGLAADQYGRADARPPLVLLHGLTFDRSMWEPALTELRRIDPDRQIIALDLPGHGESPRWPSYDVASLCEGLHGAVEDAHQDRACAVRGPHLQVGLAEPERDLTLRVTQARSLRGAGLFASLRRLHRLMPQLIASKGPQDPRGRRR